MDKKIDLTIFETKDYHKFKRLAGNRDIKSVNKILNSINNTGYIMNPIIVNEKMEIIDGQNRVEALKELNLPVHYYVIDGADIETARQLNLGRSNWKPLDYVKSYAEEGNESYQLLLKLLNDNKNYSLQMVIGICRNRPSSSGANTRCLIEGDFILSDDEYKSAQSAINHLNDIDYAINDLKGSIRTITSTMAWCIRQENVDIKRFKTLFSAKYPLIRPVIDSSDGVEYFLNDLTKIYNSNLKDKTKRINFDVIFRESL